jgi:hypothetical protein
VTGTIETFHTWRLCTLGAVFVQHNIRPTSDSSLASAKQHHATPPSQPQSPSPGTIENINRPTATKPTSYETHQLRNPPQTTRQPIPRPRPWQASRLPPAIPAPRDLLACPHRVFAIADSTPAPNCSYTCHISSSLTPMQVTVQVQGVRMSCLSLTLRGTGQGRSRQMEPTTYIQPRARNASQIQVLQSPFSTPVIQIHHLAAARCNVGHLIRQSPHASTRCDPAARWLARK